MHYGITVFSADLLIHHSKIMHVKVKGQLPDKLIFYIVNIKISCECTKIQITVKIRIAEFLHRLYESFPGDKTEYKPEQHIKLLYICLIILPCILIDIQRAYDNGFG